MDDLLRFVLQYAVAPLAAFVLWTYKKQHHKVEKIEDRVALVEVSTAVIQVKVDSIHEDISKSRRA